MTQPNSRPLPTPARPRRRWFGRILLYGLLALVAAGTWEVVTNKGVRQTLMQGLIVRNPRSAFGGKGAVTVMLLGRDEDRDNKSRVMDTLGRSDTIVLARLDFERGRISLMSIPRDTRVRIPGYRGWHKVNAAHAIGGPELTAQTVERLLGVRPDSTLVVDYEMLRKVIDALGGVRVNVDRQLDYDDNWGNLHIHLKPGWQTLNGRDAMGFVRFRHSNDGRADSDLVRIQRQQALLQALKARLNDPAAWPRIPAVLETVRREMRGTMTYTQLVAVAAFARGVPKANIESLTMPSSRSSGRFVYPDLQAAREMAERVFGRPTAVATEPEPEAPAASSRPRPSRPSATAPARPAPEEKEAPVIPDDEPSTSPPGPTEPEPGTGDTPVSETVEPEVNLGTPSPEQPAEPSPGTPAPAPKEGAPPEPQPQPAPGP